MTKQELKEMKKTIGEKYVEVYKKFHGPNRHPIDDLVTVAAIVVIIAVGYGLDKLIGGQKNEHIHTDHDSGNI